MDNDGGSTDGTQEMRPEMDLDLEVRLGLLSKSLEAIREMALRFRNPIYVNTASFLEREIASIEKELNAPVSDEDLDSLLSLASLAVRGPWKHRINPSGNTVFSIRNATAIALCQMQNQRSRNNAAYIAALGPDVMMKLIDEVKRFRKLAVAPEIIHTNMGDFAVRS